MFSDPRRFPAALLVTGLAVVVLATSCSNEQLSESLPTSAMVMRTDSAVRLPDRGAGFDYQLGGAYAPPVGTSIVERDRTDQPAGAGYDICYVNGFQTQPADSKSFARQHPDLILQADGKPVVDSGWPGEYLFDTSTAAKRAALAAIVEPWIEGCESAGYAAVEIDNLDSYTRAGELLTAEDNIAMAIQYATIAHQAGLAIAQKNTADQSALLRRAGYDFAITESCVEYRECGDYAKQYPVVLDVEYTDELGSDAFAAECKNPDRPPVIIMRDHDLTTPGDEDYFYRSCP